MDNRNYRSNPNNELGIEHDQYMNDLMTLAFTSTSEYFTFRKHLHQSLLNNILVEIHSLVFNALTLGTNTAGNAFLLPTNSVNQTSGAQITPKAFQVFNGNPMVPRFPERKANEIAMAVCSGFSRILQEKVIGNMMPQHIFDDSLNRARKVQEAMKADTN
jgi:hypothetical protein